MTSLDQARITRAAQAATEAFFAALAAEYPESTLGDLPVDACIAFDQAALSVARCWVASNLSTGEGPTP